jgi:hypothetical protein
MEQIEKACGNMIVTKLKLTKNKPAATNQRLVVSFF